jgi:hypothetical protein
VLQCNIGMFAKESCVFVCNKVQQGCNGARRMAQGARRDSAAKAKEDRRRRWKPQGGRWAKCFFPTARGIGGRWQMGDRRWAARWFDQV